MSGRPRRASHVPWAALIVGILACPVGARAETLEKFNGHLAVGYAKLFATKAPGGSMSFTGGVDYPVSPGFRAGFDLGFHLLGSRSEVRGSAVATVDYSMFEAVAFAHWIPSTLGPLGRLSFGPALLVAHADLSASAGGAGFSDLAVEDVAPGVAIDATLISRSSAPVRVGLELGGRLGFVEPEHWKLATARLAIHY